jgi:FixJ family two-component response regulator
MTGLVLAQRMLKARKSTPIMLCTGYSETALPEKARTAGIAEHIVKPFDRQELAKAVRRVLDRGSTHRT